MLENILENFWHNKKPQQKLYLTSDFTGAGILCETGTCNVIDRGGDDGLNTEFDGKGVIQLAPKGV